MSGAVYKDHEKTPLDHRLSAMDAVSKDMPAQAGKEIHTKVERLTIGERRRMVAEALVAFREYKKQWSFDTDVFTLIKERGSIPFDVWMNAVLYGPDGYYTSGRCKINGKDSHFTTVVGNSDQIAAFYFAMVDHLHALKNTDEHYRVLSVAPGAGDFEHHFSGIHKYLTQKYPNMALPTDTLLFSLDVSEPNLTLQIEGRFSFNDLPWPFKVKDGVVESDEEFQKYDRQQYHFSVPITILQEVCTLFDCEGVLVRELDLYEYYEEKVFPFLKSRINEKSYEFITAMPVYLSKIARFFSRPMSTPIAGSALELPFARGSMDAIFSNEFHDAQPSKIFVADPGSNNFEELCVTYDEVNKVFVFKTKPVAEEVKPVLDLKLAFIAEHLSRLKISSAHKKRLPLNFKRRIPTSSALGKDYIVVNMASLQYLQQVARVMKPNALLIEADYVAQVDMSDFGVPDIDLNSESMRAQLVGKQYGFLLDQLAEYQPPWVDVTTEMNHAFISWVAETLSLKSQFIETQDEFADRLIGGAKKKHPEGFKVVAFRKVNGRSRKKMR